MTGTDGRAPVELRPWRSDDADALLDAAAGSPDLDTQLPVAELTTRRGAEQVIAESLGCGDHWRNWAVVVAGTAVGSVGLSHIEHRHDTAWTSYWLAVPARGRGLAHRALASVAGWAFTEAGLFRLELGHRVNNPASCAVARRAGFAAEGVERAKLRYGDQRFDVETHARLAIDPVPDVAPLPVHGVR